MCLLPLSLQSTGKPPLLTKKKGSMGFGANFNQVDSWGHHLMALATQHLAGPTCP